MPRALTKRDPLIEAALAEWARFEEPAAWRVSKRGNLWREWDGVTLTIFRHGCRYRWSIADEEYGPRFSDQDYTTEEAAMVALGEAIGVGL